MCGGLVDLDISKREVHCRYGNRRRGRRIVYEEGLGESEEIGEIDGSIAVQIIEWIGRPEALGELEEVNEVDGAAAVEVGGLGVDRLCGEEDQTGD